MGKGRGKGRKTIKEEYETWKATMTGSMTNDGEVMKMWVKHINEYHRIYGGNK